MSCFRRICRTPSVAPVETGPPEPETDSGELPSDTRTPEELDTPVPSAEQEIADSGTCGKDGGDNLTWTLDKEGTLIISGTGEMEDYTSQGGEPWGNSCTRLVIEEGITSIGDEAFSFCSGLTGTLSIPNNVTSIGDGAFCNCSGLFGDLSIPNSVTSIGDRAFYNCSRLTGNLTIPNGVTSIGSWAFSGCSGFTGTLSIPSGVTSIGDEAFSGCSGLTGTLSIPNGVTSIGGAAFSGCSKLTGTLSIPSGVTYIGDSAFSGCSGFTGSLSIPNGVTYIGDDAFSYCSGFIGSFSIPSNVAYIGDTAFCGCSGLTNVIVSPNNHSFTSVDGVLFNATQTDLLFFPPGTAADFYSVPDGVTSIRKSAFFDCSGLSGISIPTSVSYIRESAFSNCSSLETVLYEGSEEEWGQINIAYGNEALQSAKIYYNGKLPAFCTLTVIDSHSVPTGAGEYEEGTPVILHAGT